MNKLVLDGIVFDGLEAVNIALEANGQFTAHWPFQNYRAHYAHGNLSMSASGHYARTLKVKKSVSFKGDMFLEADGVEIDGVKYPIGELLKKYSPTPESFQYGNFRLKGKNFMKKGTNIFFDGGRFDLTNSCVYNNENELKANLSCGWLITYNTIDWAEEQS